METIPTQQPPQHYTSFFRSQAMYSLIAERNVYAGSYPVSALILEMSSEGFLLHRLLRPGFNSSLAPGTIALMAATASRFEVARPDPMLYTLWLSFGAMVR